MSWLPEYYLKLSLALGLVFVFYRLVLRPLTFYNWNRWYLLGYSVLAFVIPLIDVAPVVERHQLDENSLVNWIPRLGVGSPEVSSHADTGSTGGLPEMLLVFLLAGMILMLIRLLLQALSVYRLRRRASLLQDGAVRLYQVDAPILPFSFGRSIFINRGQHSESELAEIIRHEFVHVQQRHSIDMIWAELLVIFNWFNPVAWWLRQSIRQNLEFIADDQVLQHGVDRRAYQYLLLHVSGQHRFSIAPSFNFSSLKKRIAMMNKLRTSRVHLLRFLFLLPLLAVVLFSFRSLQRSVSATPARQEKSVYLSADTLPVNAKGFIISTQEKDGNLEVLIRDKKGKEVRRMWLSSWNSDPAGFTRQYGDLPAIAPANDLPVPPPPPPVPAELKTMHPDLLSIQVKNNEVTVKKKNGIEEHYDLNKPAQKEAFTRLYGALPPPPPPPPSPAGKASAPAAPVPPREPFTEVVLPGQPAGAPEAPKVITATGQPHGEGAPTELKIRFDKAGGPEKVVKGQLAVFPVYVINGKEVTRAEVDQIPAGQIREINVLKGESAVARYGERARDGAVLITLHDKPQPQPLFVLDGTVISQEEMDKLDPRRIISVNVLKGENAQSIYGEKGKNGVVVITTRQ